MIVNLAVINDNAGAVVVEHRLLAGFEIDYREASMAEPDVSGDKTARFVRPAMMENIPHPDDLGFLRRTPRAFAVNYAVNAAHLNVE